LEWLVKADRKSTTALEAAGGLRRLVMVLERVSEAWNTMRKRTVDAMKIDALQRKNDVLQQRFGGLEWLAIEDGTPTTALEAAGGFRRLVMGLERVSDAWNTMRKRTVGARKVDAL